jgi:RNA polymerase sigma-70 factor (ECF subfamily)
MTVQVEIQRPGAAARLLNRAVLLHLGGVLRDTFAHEAGTELPKTLQTLLDRWPRAGIRSAAERARFEQDILAAMPALKRFAMRLSGHADRAEDLVQEAVCRGLTNADRFEPGTNVQAWLFTILRNFFMSNYRRRRNEVDDPHGMHVAGLAMAPGQSVHVDLKDFVVAFRTLSRDQREALTLIGVQGYSYEEAAGMTGVAIGTIKSRVNRGRVRLVEILKLEEDEADHVMRAALEMSRSSTRLS